MDIQTRKIEFVQAFLKLQSEEMISLFESILKSGNKDDFHPMSIDELNKRIDKSEKDFETGKVKIHDEVFAKYS